MEKGADLMGTLENCVDRILSGYRQDALVGERASRIPGCGLAILKLLYMYASVEHIRKYIADHENQVSYC